VCLCSVVSEIQRLINGNLRFSPFLPTAVWFEVCPGYLWYEIWCQKLEFLCYRVWLLVLSQYQRLFRQTDGLTDGRTDRDKRTDRDRHTDRQTDRQKQTDRNAAYRQVALLLQRCCAQYTL